MVVPEEDALPIRGWFSHSKVSYPHSYIQELGRRYGAIGGIGWIDEPEGNGPWLWIDEIRHLRRKRSDTDEPKFLEPLGHILCQALGVSGDCPRSLSDGQQHEMLFFTNERVIQVYCTHEKSEYWKIIDLIKANKQFDPSKGETYHQITDHLFEKARPYLAGSCNFPDGLDMEALSPRDPNAHVRVKKETKKEPPKIKGLMNKLVGKEKDHPPPPPAEVYEPPSSDRSNGATYKTGRCLGKGGFAICYEGKLAGTEQIYALKIVKSHMPQKKMEQKVRIS